MYKKIFLLILVLVVSSLLTGCFGPVTIDADEALIVTKSGKFKEVHVSGTAQ